MRLPTNQTCREAPSTSYSCSRCSIVPRLTPRLQSKSHRKQRAAPCCSSGHEDFQTQEAWNRLELITRYLRSRLTHVLEQTSFHTWSPAHQAFGLLIKTACRKLAVAISEENYPLAAQLSSEKQSLSQDLPPVSQYTFHQLQELQKGLETGDVAQQYLAVRKLGADHIKQTGCSAPGTTACLHTLHRAHMLICCVTSLFFMQEALATSLPCHTCLFA